MISNCNITIYNKYYAPYTRTEKYQRSVIYSVGWQLNKSVWQSAQALSGAKSGKLIESTALIFIPFSSGVKWKPPLVWDSLAVRTGYWTLRDDDIIVRGIVLDEITDLIPAVIDPPAAAIPAFSMTDLRKKYDYVLTIFAVADLEYGSPNVQHWEVGCK